MPIYETYDLNDPRIAGLTFYGADLISTGETFARLYSFVQDDTRSMDVFRCDVGSLSSLRRAAARIAGLKTDKVSDVQWARTGEQLKSGVRAWVRVPKSGKPKSGVQVKTTQVKSYSGAAQRKGVATLRETFGVSVERAATLDDGTVVVRLARGESADKSADTV